MGQVRAEDPRHGIPLLVLSPSHRLPTYHVLRGSSVPSQLFEDTSRIHEYGSSYGPLRKDVSILDVSLCWELMLFTELQAV
jgi:hypothetical protein